MRNNLIRYNIFSIEEILPLISEVKHQREYTELTSVTGQKLKVKINSPRLQFLKEHQTCNNCKIIGAFFALENHKTGNCENPHLNLYGFDDNEQEVQLNVQKRDTGNIILCDHCFKLFQKGLI